MALHFLLLSTLISYIRSTHFYIIIAAIQDFANTIIGTEKSSFEHVLYAFCGLVVGHMP